MSDATTAWLQSHAHLPPFLRDFHDQKDLFQAMHEIIDMQSNTIARKVDWVKGQVYVIDVFLWFMARRGYTLQRSRAKVPFRDLHEDVANVRERRMSRALPHPKQHNDGGADE
ncbi:hypothetical protein [Achromobacter marplatensis]|uniref:Uncharacterized protein n=1 Tax=Achromobacter marplatensis TaxID=470868 RepID=A0ABX9FRC8_9BURK|nr:hypothetical protein [Achromobacter marplatensis]RBP08720.1 hypothetical protein DFP87_1432 [Achromobacter marplatensis]CAB3717733.1 hypothetical protein LMG26219_06338 [Achromobacter marplatensis]